jgi:hypothetical protein
VSVTVLFKSSCGARRQESTACWERVDRNQTIAIVVVISG